MKSFKQSVVKFISNMFNRSSWYAAQADIVINQMNYIKSQQDNIHATVINRGHMWSHEAEKLLSLQDEWELLNSRLSSLKSKLN